MLEISRFPGRAARAKYLLFLKWGAPPLGGASLKNARAPIGAEGLDEVLDHAQEVREAYANETRKGPRIQVGNLVFLRKGHVRRRRR